jgi:ribosomal protein S27AE
MLTESKQQANVQVDLSQAETILCEQCQNGLFIASFFLKRISALVSPTGKEAIIPLQVYSCGNCGHINNKLNPTLDTNEKTKTDN